MLTLVPALCSITILQDSRHVHNRWDLGSNTSLIRYIAQQGPIDPLIRCRFEAEALRFAGRQHLGAEESTLKTACQIEKKKATAPSAISFDRGGIQRSNERLSAYKDSLASLMDDF